ncbi:hypothetical protein ACCS96_47340, partial [Rhizobium ruizarguesonis]
QGRNAVEDGKTVAGGASLAGPKAGAGRDGRNLKGEVLMEADVADLRVGVTPLASQMSCGEDGSPARPRQ